MRRTFRKYHRALALVVALPLILTMLTGIAVTIVEEWSISVGLSRSLLLKIHTGQIFHLEAFYPIFNGLGLAVMLLTGLSMTNLFSQKKKERPEPK